MDNIIVDANQTIHANDKITKDIHVIAQHTEGEVGELRGKIEEILKHQKSFQATLDAISGKNSLLSFLLEYLSKSTLTEFCHDTFRLISINRTKWTNRREVFDNLSTNLRTRHADDSETTTDINERSSSRSTG